ncbi:hypothetical protein LZ30DRAFT_279922 [Colletotrichum cereale]|nr:hypothetical protein LZ30DRAFT_279922 [Colletotrichum cereale]
MPRLSYLGRYRILPNTCIRTRKASVHSARDYGRQGQQLFIVSIHPHPLFSLSSIHPLSSKLTARYHHPCLSPPPCPWTRRGDDHRWAYDRVPSSPSSPASPAREPFAPNHPDPRRCLPFPSVLGAEAERRNQSPRPRNFPTFTITTRPFTSYSLSFGPYLGGSPFLFPPTTYPSPIPYPTASS